MSLLSTFNPSFQRKTIKENVELYWADNVINIKKSRLFLWTKIIIPFTFWTILFIVWLIFFSSKLEVNWFLWFVIFLFVFLWLIPSKRAIKYYLDYKMDFIIVNPRAFMRYDQDWFLKTISKTIDLKKIRSVSVRKKWFFNSIFNNWTLIVLSEWWEYEKDAKMRAGEVVFTNVYNPELYNKKINDLLSSVFKK
jgi:hypothetical protein